MSDQTNAGIARKSLKSEIRIEQLLGHKVKASIGPAQGCAKSEREARAICEEQAIDFLTEGREFISQASKEGLDLPTITKLLRYASTLQRLAVAQCNWDWPYNGDRDRPLPRNEATEQHDKLYTVCPKCEASGVAKSAMRKPAACEECTDQKESRRFCKHQICPH